MSITATHYRTQPPSHYPRIKTPDRPRRSSPNPNTINRVQNTSFEPQPRSTMESPTPATRQRTRRSRKGTRKADQRDPQDANDGPVDQDPSSEDELMGLLGVEAKPGPSTTAVSSSAPPTETPANAGGVLQISKEDIVASVRGRGAKQDADGAGKGRKSNESNPRQTPKKKGNKRETVVEKGFSPAGEIQDTPPPTKTKPRAANSAKHANSHARRVREENGALSDSGLQPFNLSALSRSLPSQNEGLLGPKLKSTKTNGKDRHEVWDAAAATGSDNLTVGHQSVLDLLCQADHTSGSKSYKYRPSALANSKHALKAIENPVVPPLHSIKTTPNHLALVDLVILDEPLPTAYPVVTLIHRDLPHPTRIRDMTTTFLTMWDSISVDLHKHLRKMLSSQWLPTRPCPSSLVNSRDSPESTIKHSTTSLDLVLVPDPSWVLQAQTRED